MAPGWSANRTLGRIFGLLPSTGRHAAAILREAHFCPVGGNREVPRRTEGRFWNPVNFRVRRHPGAIHFLMS
jgi:hypothetical protein